MGAEFYVLIDRKTNKVALMKSGKPFVYTTLKTARMGAKYLGLKRKTKFKVTPRFTGAIVT
jgi:hypothetical protein